MKPRLAEALSGWLGFPLPLPDYGHLLSLALLVGLLWTHRRLRRLALADPAQAETVLFAVLGIYLGAKILYLAQYHQQIESALESPLAFIRNGYSLYGGLLGLISGVAFAARRHRVGLRAVLDAMTPAMALGLAIARLGCFLAGCNFGRPSEVAWAVRFPAESPAWFQQVAAGLLSPNSPLSLPVHPTQLYESALGIVLCLAAVGLAPRLAGRGGLFFTLLAAYALFRAPEESIRADAGGATFGSLTFSQGVSLALGVAAVAGLLWVARESRRRPLGEPAA
jgi:phosphatidylglycerol:prolipoprotein diacylglycerol transferase